MKPLLLGLTLVVVLTPTTVLASGKICDGQMACRLQQGLWMLALTLPTSAAMAGFATRGRWPLPVSLILAAGAVTWSLLRWRDPTWDVLYNLGPGLLLPLPVALGAAILALVGDSRKRLPPSDPGC